MKKFLTVMLAAVMLAALFAGCTEQNIQNSNSASALSTATPGSGATAAPPSELDLDFSNRDAGASYELAGATVITCKNGSFAINGAGASAEGNVLTLSAEGTYVLSGELTEGRIIVDAADTDKLQIVLNGLSLHSSNHAPLYIRQADKVFITLADQSVNTLTDGASRDAASDEESKVDGVIFSRSDLCINGSGQLNITAAYKHGIVSKDDLIITGGMLNITANGQGLSGKDAVKIQNGTFVLNTKGDGIQADNTEDSAKGFVYIENGSFEIEAEADAIQAETCLIINGGTFTLTCGGGSANASTDQSGNNRPQWGGWGQSSGNTASAKGLKCAQTLIINGGVFTVDSSDDAIHCNGDMTIAGGQLTITSGDDGIHADSALLITGGSIVITKSYEGLEGQTVTVQGGEISVTASDDGINAAGGNDASSIGGRPGQNHFDSDLSCEIRISGGKVYINAEGDGIDSNGNFYLEGGEVYVSGPTNGGNGALDYGGEGIATGGVLIAVGSVSMAQGFSSSSRQCSILYTLSSSQQGDITLTDAQGTALASFTPEKTYQSVVVTAPQMQVGETYALYAGTVAEEITLSGIVTANIGNYFPGGGDHGGGPGGFPGGRPGGKEFG
ncbi:MAG: carbohydrate-binding domain-containing protein [Clostridiales bacterium]|nr:carbohydrate-binding domain-containing protein [Clostridiales bacterium]